MRLARQAAKGLLIFIALCETGVAWQLWKRGRPMEMVVTSDKVKEAGEISFKMVPIRPSASDYALLTVVLAFQLALIGFLWWSRRESVRN